MVRPIVLFTDSANFGYDVIASLSSEELLSQAYIQTSPVQHRVGQYFLDALRLRRLDRRIVGLVDRINRPSRVMSIDINDDILKDVDADSFVSFRELRHRVVTEDAIVIVYGTGIAPAWIYENAFQSINVHWGLSPYYRGILCTDWAILNGDLSNIGFTLHELSTKIDGGQIITQGRVEPQEGDSIGSITYRLHQKAKSALLKSVAAAQHGKLQGTPQNLANGKNYTSRDWTIKTSIRLRRLLPITQKRIDESGPELPIHENPAFTS